MPVQTKPCRNAGELVNTISIGSEEADMKEYTHRCMQPHTADHEYFNLTPDGLCPHEDTCPHFEAVA